MLSPRCFETGRRSLTQSSVEALVAETANGCLVLHRTGTIAERHKPRAEELEKTFHALLRFGDICPFRQDVTMLHYVENRRMEFLRSTGRNYRAARLKVQMTAE